MADASQAKTCPCNGQVFSGKLIATIFPIG